MPDIIGQTLGKYRVVARLGRGGMAEVYKAYQPGLDRFVAIKVLHSHLAEDKDFVGRFEREARAVANLRHPNIVQVFDFDVQDEMYYMAMEFVQGPTFKAELVTRSEQNQPFNLQEITRIMSALCAAIDYAHSQGMVHRDLKPANFILTRRGQILILDFGIAKIVGATQFTATGAMSGTPAYMSPEQGRGERGDERSDIYSLGIVLYEMVTGRVPFDADTPFAIIMKHITDPLPTPRSIKPEIPQAIEDIILKALSKEPDERYQNGAALTAALKEATGVSPYDNLTNNPIVPLAVVSEVEELDPADPIFTTVRKPTQQTLQLGQAETKAGAAATVASSQQSQKSGFPWLLIGGGGGILLIIAIIAGIIFNNQNNQQNNLAITATFQAEERTAQETAAALALLKGDKDTPTPSPTLPAQATATPTNTPDLEATVLARITAAAEAEELETAVAAATELASIPTDTPAPTPSDTPVPTDTPLATDTPRPTDTAAPLAPTNPPAPTATPTTAATPTPQAPQLSGRIAIPIDNSAQYDVRIYSVPDGQQIGRINAARQPFFRGDGMLLVNGETGPVGGGAGDNIFMYNSDGSGGTPISGSPNDGYPTWSPDGSRIAYDNNQLVLAKTGGPNEWHLFVQPGLTPVSASEMATFNIIEGDIFEAGQPMYPIWAEDDYLLFRACDLWPGGRGGSNCGIWRTPSWATVNGTGFQIPARVTDFDGVPTDSAGSTLIFMSRNSGNWEVYRTGITGGGSVNLTNNAGQDGLGTISPDGKWVAFVSDRGGSWAVWVVSINGGEASKLFDLPPAPWGAGDHDWTRERISWGP